MDGAGREDVKGSEEYNRGGKKRSCRKGSSQRLFTYSNFFSFASIRRPKAKSESCLNQTENLKEPVCNVTWDQGCSNKQTVEQPIEIERKRNGGDVSALPSSRDQGAKKLADLEMKAKVEKYLKDVDLKLKEVLDTERRYVQTLREVVYGYIPLMHQGNKELQMPSDLATGKDRIVMGNVRDLLSFHETVMLPQIERASRQDPEHFEKMLATNMSDLKDKYGKYCLNRPKSQYIIAQHNEYFTDLHDLGCFHQSLDSGLHESVTRLPRLYLLLSEVVKVYEKAQNAALKSSIDFDHTERLKSIKGAMEKAHDISNYSDNMMDVGRIENYGGSLTAHGLLLMHTGVKCYLRKPGFRGKPCSKTCQLFIFEQAIIICDKSAKQYSTPGDPYPFVLNFFTSFQINKIDLREIVRGYGSSNSCFEVTHKGAKILVGSMKRWSARSRKVETSSKATNEREKTNQGVQGESDQAKEIQSIVIECETEFDRDKCLGTINGEIRKLRKLLDWLGDPMAGDGCQQ